MKSILFVISFSVYCLTFAESSLADVVPSPQTLKELGICSDGRIEKCFAHAGIVETHQYSFTVFKVLCGDRCFYVFISGVVDDSVEYAFESPQEALNFYAVRFRGIANDLIHGKRRPDVARLANWLTDPRDVRLMALSYAGFATEIEDLITKNDSQKQQPVNRTSQPKHGEDQRANG